MVSLISIDERLEQLDAWIAELFPNVAFFLTPVSGDASFRRYFRLRVDGESYVIMDAPPKLESCEAFIKISKAFQFSSVRFPFIFSADTENGFLLLTDFGDQQLLHALQPKTANKLYEKARLALSGLQRCEYIPNYELPSFNADLFWREFQIFFDWFLLNNKKMNTTDHQEQILREAYQSLINNIVSQPYVFTHRDFHSRNLMVCDDGMLGILDFQDAVWGPITYDCVSLLKDCYISWSEKNVDAWVRDCYKQFRRDKKLPGDVSLATFKRWFDLTGFQRHLKCVGIFSRLAYRDHKSHFLNEIPRVLQYLRDVSERYPELSPFKTFL